MRRNQKARKIKTPRKIGDLVSVGPKIVAKLALLDIFVLDDLVRATAENLYQQLCELEGLKHDICLLDTFQAAIMQAKNPKLPAEQKHWWYWSRLRKLRS